MTVLIANINKDYLLSINKKITFKEASKNTSTFECSNKEFEAIRKRVREDGNNPFAVMSW